eukprot:scaffold24446_cov97-Skeletonema_dohrnii-CCMP3373.AAC.1
MPTIDYDNGKAARMTIFTNKLKATFKLHTAEPMSCTTSTSIPIRETLVDGCVQYPNEHSSTSE